MRLQTWVKLPVITAQKKHGFTISAEKITYVGCSEEKALKNPILYFGVIRILLSSQESVVYP